MKQLVVGLAHMSSVRDRDLLDALLVRLLVQNCSAPVESARLLRIVGEDSERRCLTRAMFGNAQAQAERDAVWADWSDLPHLSDFPLRQACVDEASVVCEGVGPCTTVIPVNQQVGICAVVELMSSVPCSEDQVEVIESVVLHYQNLLGLLDYGEKDALTELLNRKTFDGAFFKAAAFQRQKEESEFKERRTEHSDAGYWLAVLDIDHFKRVNDNYGHQIGDEVLLLMARLMRANFRFHDQLYRFGGEEFVILMHCVDSANASGALERLRERVQSHQFPQVGSITVSIGFSPLRDNDTPGGAFGRADKAVYFAKSNGRNQVCSYHELVEKGLLVEEIAADMDVDLF